MARRRRCRRGYDDEHAEPQLIPAGLELTDPDPGPARATDNTLHTPKRIPNHATVRVTYTDVDGNKITKTLRIRK